MSQEKLGGALGVTFQQVQKYEKGANRISASRLQHIANMLQVPASFFFEDVPDGGGMTTHRKAPSPAYVNDFLSTADGLALIKAFHSIRSSKLRRCIVAVVEGMADGGL